MANNLTYKKKHQFNIGIVIFIIIFGYIVLSIGSFIRTKHISGYEVQLGTLSKNNVYRALALRKEHIVPSSGSGYINYFVREGTRVAVGNLVYTVDETGQINELVSGADGNNGLSDSDLGELKTEILGFANTFDETNFSDCYEFKYSVQGTVMKLANYNILDSISDLSNGSNIGLNRAENTGILVYSTDGYELKQPQNITAKDISGDDYQKNQLISNNLINKGDPAYKIVLDENWSLMIPVDEEKAAELEEAEYVKVKFLKDQNESWAQCIIHNNEDGMYCELKLNNSMITYCTERYIDIEIVTNEMQGLKIPNSAIIEKEFFLVPVEYVTKGSSGKEGVMRETYKEDGTKTTEFIESEIYNEEDGNYYLTDDRLRIGDTIQLSDGTATFDIGKRAPLIGVFNMNKGYADFKQIEILYQNDEYSIVKSNTMYGLSVYDYIVLDADTVKKDDLIND